MPEEQKIKTKKVSAHYVNNREFSTAVMDYIELAKAAKVRGEEEPQISNYIGECILKICEGLSRKPNFNSYSYRDEMVMDAVENCVERIQNFDRAAFEERKKKITTQFKEDLSLDDLRELGQEHGSSTKSVNRWYGEWLNDSMKAPQKGLPNAFAYFTQIAWFAFLRRIAKEQKQWDIKVKYIETASLGSFADFGDDESHSGDSLIERVRSRTNSLSKDDSFIEDDEFVPKKNVTRCWGSKKKARLNNTTASLYDADVA